MTGCVSEGVGVGASETIGSIGQKGFADAQIEENGDFIHRKEGRNEVIVRIKGVDPQKLCREAGRKAAFNEKVKSAEVKKEMATSNLGGGRLDDDGAELLKRSARGHNGGGRRLAARCGHSSVDSGVDVDLLGELRARKEEHHHEVRGAVSDSSARSRGSEAARNRRSGVGGRRSARARANRTRAAKAGGDKTGAAATVEGGGARWRRCARAAEGHDGVRLVSTGGTVASGRALGASAGGQRGAPPRATSGALRARTARAAAAARALQQGAQARAFCAPIGRRAAHVRRGRGAATRRARRRRRPRQLGARASPLSQRR
ncbi:hypothetical protein FGB62_322g029 [Gracilaria domingensis]|nr:hypothetical protein FGB62_322g029 [Gracilaria domingensis]